MFTQRYIPFSRMFKFSWRRLAILTLWGIMILVVYTILGIREIALPWQHFSIIGMAVSFYLGFKNNSSYDRLWEARKIWGGIINASRSWGSEVMHLIKNANVNASEEEVIAVKKELIYRHIAWVYTLRKRLLEPAGWEHNCSKSLVRFKSIIMQNAERKYPPVKLEDLLDQKEIDALLKYKNTCTGLINTQVKELNKVASLKLLDRYKHTNMINILETFYDLQGKCERIKNYPLPRQYSNTSHYFVWVFLLALPFCMIGVFDRTDNHYITWMFLPSYIIISWFFVLMEMVGDYAENPFEGLANDVPLLSLCKTIEIDLRQIIGEPNIVEKPQSDEKGILM